jgi:hypothetical protein
VKGTVIDDDVSKPLVSLIFWSMEFIDQMMMDRGESLKSRSLYLVCL